MIEIDREKLTPFEIESARHVRDQRLSDVSESERPDPVEFLEMECNNTLSMMGKLYKQSMLPTLEDVGLRLLALPAERQAEAVEALAALERGQKLTAYTPTD